MSLDHLGDWTPKSNFVLLVKPPEKKYAALIYTYESVYEANDVKFQKLQPFKNKGEMMEYARDNPNAQLIEYTNLKITLNVEVDVA
jgi:hypothetical protein